MTSESDTSVESHVPQSVRVYWPNVAAASNAWMGNWRNTWYHVEYGMPQGTCPIAVHRADSLMLVADLSKRERKRVAGVVVASAAV